MSDEPPVIAKRFPIPRRVLSLVGVVAIAGYFFWTGKVGQDYRHMEVLHRIDRHLKPIRNSMSGESRSPPPKPKPDPEWGRREIILAISTALSNWPFYYRANTVPGKLAAIADRLDATQGSDLQTFEGCCRLLVMCDEASWSFHDYPMVTELYEREADGTIPKLPKLGERWANDERRK